jgi:hypothetical protein
VDGCAEGRAPTATEQARPLKTAPDLDIRTKSTSALVPHDSDGVVSEQHDPTLKWQLQAMARLAVGVYDRNHEYKDGHRIRICCRHPLFDEETKKDSPVQVRRSEKSKRAYYSGLMKCASVWVCPICAPKIQAVRALEVRTAIDNWTAQGGSVVLVTQTIPHGRRDHLEPLLERFTTALMKFKGQRSYERARKDFGIAGSIRALEVTHGANGWHPHAHTILFLRDSPLLRHVHMVLFSLWKSAALRAGFEQALSPEAFDVQDASEVKNYVTKMGTEYQWNAEHELVKAHSKRGSSHSMTPFDMLRGLLDEARPELRARFAEYAACFNGKRQLVWSNGFKKELLGTDGPTDEQIAESIGEDDSVLADISPHEWIIIRRNNLQGYVLQIASDYGRTGLDHFLSEYRV